MESQSAPQDPQREDVEGGGKLGSVYCRCGEGWTCVITKTVGPDAGKAFIKCTGNCACSIQGEVVKQKESKEVGDGAYCKCGEGWSCEISRTEAPKGFECSGPCSCELDPK